MLSTGYPPHFRVRYPVYKRPRGTWRCIKWRMLEETPLLSATFSSCKVQPSRSKEICLVGFEFGFGFVLDAIIYREGSNIWNVTWLCKFFASKHNSSGEVMIFLWTSSIHTGRPHLILRGAGPRNFRPFGFPPTIWRFGGQQLRYIGEVGCVCLEIIWMFVAGQVYCIYICNVHFSTHIPSAYIYLRTIFATNSWL